MFSVAVTESLYGPGRNKIASRWEYDDADSARTAWLETCALVTDACVIVKEIDAGGWSRTLATAEINSFPVRV